MTDESLAREALALVSLDLHGVSDRVRENLHGVIVRTCAKAREEGAAAGEAEGSPFSPDNMLAIFKGQRKP